MGSKLGTIFAQTGHDVIFSYSRSETKLEQPARDDAASKVIAARLIRDAGFDPVDAGPLRIARHIEPFTMLIGRLAYHAGNGPALTCRFERLAEVA